MPVIDSPRFEHLDDAVVATVAYSDVFDMPVDRVQLHRLLLGWRCDREEVDRAVEAACAAGRLVQSGDLVHLPDRSEVLDVHRDRTGRAEDMWRQAMQWSRWLGRVPFVRGVAVTGGLAVDSVAPHDDVDFLVVTAPRRLWLTRAMIVVIVRIADRSDIELCPNFLVTSDAMEMQDRTAYSARELAQMVDVIGGDVLDELRGRNDWLLEHLPNAAIEGDRSLVTDPGWSRRRAVAERVLSSRIFDRVERWEMDRKIAKLSTVSSRRPEVGRPDESSFSPQRCKGHMVGNAAGIDVAWRDRLRQHVR